jgi:hypothetical protein
MPVSQEENCEQGKRFAFVQGILCPQSEHTFGTPPRFGKEEVMPRGALAAVRFIESAKQ